MSLISMKEILKDSVSKSYAVGAFVTCDHTFSEAIICAAEEKGVPAILMVAEIGFKFMQLDHFFPYIIDRIHRSSVPIALHLDHGSSYETIVKAIHYGCTSVMIDGSELPYENNIELTKKVVETAHSAGVSVEAELGHVSGGEGDIAHGSLVDENMFTDPQDAMDFVKKTGIDALAVAFGTVHGVYRHNPKLDLKRLQEIRNSVDIPLVMHGGSGLSIEDFQNAVKSGINKINFFTDLSLAAVEAVKKKIKEKEGHLHYPELILEVQKRAVAVVKKQIDIFGTLPLTR